MGVMVLSVLGLVITDTKITSLWPHGASSKIQNRTLTALGWTTALTVMEGLSTRVMAALTLLLHPETKDRAMRLGKLSGTQKSREMEEMEEMEEMREMEEMEEMEEMGEMEEMIKLKREREGIWSTAM